MSQLVVDSISQQQVSIVTAATSNREGGYCIGIFIPISSGEMKEETDLEEGTYDGRS
jgi:hypothetical protein